MRPDVSRLGLGTAALSLPYGAPGAERPAPPPAAARRTLRAAAEQGVRFFDTAPAYGRAEELLGEALGTRSDCTVATKLAIPPGGWRALAPARVRAHVRASARSSLLALRRERLDVLQVHNATCELIRHEPLLEALAELRQEGLVRWVGATVYGEDAALAAVAEPGVDLVQVACSLLDRRPERRVLPAALVGGTVVVARSLLLHGVLTPAGRDLGGSMAALGAAADAARRALGVTWEELPGAAVAFVAALPGVSCALLGPHDEVELLALLRQSRRFAAVTAGVRPVVPALPSRLLDPSCWPVEAVVAG